MYFVLLNTFNAAPPGPRVPYYASHGRRATPPAMVIRQTDTRAAAPGGDSRIGIGASSPRQPLKLASTSDAVHSSGTESVTTTGLGLGSAPSAPLVTLQLRISNLPRSADRGTLYTAFDPFGAKDVKIYKVDSYAVPSDEEVSSSGRRVDV